MTAASWRQARTILCVRLDSLGDVLMCTPAMRALRAGGASLTLLGSPSGVAALPHIPELDDALVCEAPWMKHAPRPSDLLDIARQLRARRFDAAVIFTSYSQSALPAAMLCLLAGIPLRLAHCRENPYHLLSDWRPDPEPQAGLRHEVRRQLDLVASVGYGTARTGLSFALRGADLASSRERLAGLGIGPGRPWILLHPGASAASRRYPPAHWAQLLRLLARRWRHPLVFTGSADEADLIAEIRRAAGMLGHSLAGQLNLGQLGAAIALARVVVANNSGPAHMAAALGTPLVQLYALTNPQHAPWQVETRVLFHDVPCRMCYKSVCAQGHHACLRGVAPDRVLAAVADLLGE